MGTFDVYTNAIKYGMKVNETMKLPIISALNRQKERFGDFYCPCSPKHNEDTICPCKNMRENRDCHCKLYIKEDAE